MAPVLNSEQMARVRLAYFFARCKLPGRISLARCWPYCGPRVGAGMRIRLNEGNRLAMRVAWEFIMGEPPDGYGVSRTCTTANCCNVMHAKLIKLPGRWRKAKEEAA